MSRKQKIMQKTPHYIFTTIYAVDRIPVAGITKRVRRKEWLSGTSYFFEYGMKLTVREGNHVFPSSVI